MRRNGSLRGKAPETLSGSAPIFAHTLSKVKQNSTKTLVFAHGKLYNDGIKICP